MRANRYRRDVTQYTEGRWGFTITDNTSGVIAYQGTGYTNERDAKHNADWYIIQTKGQRALGLIAESNGVIAAQSRLF